MKWWIGFFTLTLGLSAQADYTNPAEALGPFLTGSCETINETFTSNPRRAYRWMSSDSGAPSDFVDALSSVATPECAQQLAHSFAWTIARSGQRDRRDNNQRSQRASRMLTRLLQLGNITQPEAAYFEAVRACVSPEEHRSNPLSFIGDVFRSVSPNTDRPSSSCSVPGPGEVKVVRGVKGGISSAYALRRNPNGGFDVLLNYDFRPYTGPNSAGAPTPDQMRASVAQCLQQASPFLNGPDGIHLNMVLMGPEEIQAMPSGQRPPSHQVNIQPATLENGALYRGNSGNFTTSMGCETILHESMHVLGLCDEYREGSPYLVGICRISTMPNTLMRDMWQAYNDGTSQDLQCRCDANCQRAQTIPELKRLYEAPGFNDLVDSQDRNMFCRLRSSAASGVPDVEWVHNNDFRGHAKLTVTSNQPSMLSIDEFIVGDSQWNAGYIQHWDCSCPPSVRNECQPRLDMLRARAQRLDQLRPVGCPQNQEAISRTVNPSVAAGGNVQDTVSGNILTRRKPGSLPSGILAPIHYRRILAGQCDAASPNYNRCAEWATKSRPADAICRRQDPTGNVAKDNATEANVSEECRNARAAETCSDRPSQCADPHYYLGF